jgi:hypothetical protein
MRISIRIVGVDANPLLLALAPWPVAGQSPVQPAETAGPHAGEEVRAWPNN